jgi:predicted nuclease of predicted toxin-antitoxin system
VSFPLYMDHHVPRVITQGLRARGVDVLTAFEDGTDRLSDSDLLDRAGQLGRVLFTQDYDFLAETARRQQQGKFFRGVILALASEIWSCSQKLATRRICSTRWSFYR